MFSAGAAAPTQGPLIEKLDGAPFWPIPPTVSTNWEYQAGETTVCTSFQPRGSDGTAAFGGGFWVQSRPVLPAATTTTEFLTLVA
jgi:hypothetical protein